MEAGYALGKDIQMILTRLERLEALSAANGRSTEQGRAAEEGGAGLDAPVAAEGRSTGPTNLCTLKVLPQTDWVAAAARAVTINPVNAPATHMLRAAALDVVIPPEHLALLTQKYWGAGGVHLTVGFFGAPP